VARGGGQWQEENDDCEYLKKHDEQDFLASGDGSGGRNASHEPPYKDADDTVMAHQSGDYTDAGQDSGGALQRVANNDYYEPPNTGYDENYAGNVRDENYGSGAWNDNNTSGAWDDNYASGARDDNYASGARDDNCAGGARGDNYAGGARDENCASGARDDNCASGSWDENCATGAWDENNASGAWDENCATGAWDENCAVGAWDENDASGAWDENCADGAWDENCASSSKEGVSRNEHPNDYSCCMPGIDEGYTPNLHRSSEVANQSRQSYDYSNLNHDEGAPEFYE